VGKNVAVFVDVANIFYAAKAAGVDIDYVTLLKSATSGRDLVRAYAYTGLDPDNENQRNFHDFLRRHGYKVVSKDIRKYGDGKVKANLDIELVVDMMKTARNLDIAIVISGDGDFAPAIRAVQEMGVRVEVISFRGNTSSDLIDVADQFSDIAALAKVEKGSSRSGRRVSGDDEDLSMTAVPEKQSEGTGAPRGRGRGRGRTRTVEVEPVVVATNGEASLADAALVALPGEKLSRARRGAPIVEPAAVEEGAEGADEALNGDPLDSDMSPEGEERRRRRRRRGGRGRGRGREAVAGAVEGAAPVDAEDVDEEEPIADARPARANSTFGSIWDSQLGVNPNARTASTPSRGGPIDEDLDEPPIPEYLIAERRGGGGQSRGRGGPRSGGARGAYAAAMDRERFGAGGRGGSSGGSGMPGRASRYAEPAPRRDAGRGRPPEYREARPPRSGNSDEPWSEVPPELEAMLRAQVAARRPASPPTQVQSASSAAPAEEATPVAARRRPATRGRAATGETGAEAPAPKATRTRTARSKAPAAASSAPEASAESSAVEPAATPKRRTTRKAASETPATPKRRTTRKASSSDAG
jgi:uncharacterized LabA/DUF88 family protein